MKLAHLIEPLTADMRIIASFHKVTPTSVAHMRQLLTQVSVNRAYDDSHPRWQQATRVLPYDGRDYCFYYADGANDTHVETLLKRILKGF